ncbi:ABC transporter ATP-binding protein [Dictyoglomus thermophilum]|uniref:ABC-type multidrug/protein/lipid transport system, ATPase component n=1 Tax=Dictyoglomus thermophilum (strain ATCC 35947 / DSM 3960 / H-6-12) TaxID=309799 RepID=B5YCY3_DICT6|nr:ABC transporter ATP-binding protein [Dictyoglomus thermophilum]ACI19726.1 ABC-type multidrug/protein/lipid transport system, ATPase component [Dictyoglomus thermophilum H-6-12]
MNYYPEEEILGKAYDSRIMRRLLKYAKPYLRYLILALVLIILITLLKLVNPYIIKNSIDKSINPIKTLSINGKEIRVYYIDEKIPIDLLQRYNGIIKNFEGKKYILLEDLNKLSLKDRTIVRFKDINNLKKSALNYFLILILIFILTYAQVYILNLTSQKIIFDMRKELFEHILKLPLSFFDKNPVGRLVTRVTNDIETLQQMYNSVITSFVVDIFLILGLSIVMLIINWKLALICIVSLPIVGYISFIFRKYAREAYRNFRIRLARLNAYLAEHINGVRVTQVFAREKENEKEFKEINNKLLEAQLRNVFVNAIFRPAVSALGSIVSAFLIFFGGWQIMNNQMSFGTIFLFLSYLGSFFQPIQDLAEKYDILQDAMASAERIFLLRDEKITIDSPPNPIRLNNLRGEIEFKNVWFAYDKEWVLKDLSFKIEPGEKVAFVGATGAGKTSIINLITRFYDVQKGEILIDGINIKDIDLRDLRRQISVVLQDVHLFATTILENIRLNRDDIPEEKVIEAAKLVNADKFIRELPQGYYTPVQERGATLSAGQRQLIAFARALVFDPKILILDEATANIDTQTEKLIQDAIEKVIQGRTSIIIAHRLSTIKKVDTIYVMHKGRIVEKGNHQELIKKRGIYYHLYKLQSLNYANK